MPELCTEEEVKIIEQAACEKWPDFDPLQSKVFWASRKKLMVTQNGLDGIIIETKHIAGLSDFALGYNRILDLLVIHRYA